MLAFTDLKLDAVEAQLRSVANDGSIDEACAFAQWLPDAAHRARALGTHWDIMTASREIGRLLGNVFPKARSDVCERDRLRRVAVARLALEHFSVEENLPDCILSLLPDFFRRLANFVSDGRKKYDDEYFVKDVRYALGLTLPGGALQFDVASHIGPKLILRQMRHVRSPEALMFYLLSRGWGRWYNEHIDLRAMREFNPDGWTDHCARMAKLLERNPDVAGIVGAGWFYDPAVAEVSPGVGYIQKTQTRHGAYLIRIGTERHHIDNALHRSATRRKLYEEGKYLPTCYMCAWPRRAVLAWARRLEREPSVGFGNSDAPQSRTAKPSLSQGRSEIATPTGAHLGAT
ncbi:MAG TPA: hypothetical protein VN154_11175 [Rhizomicrobium sp.]|nr:hypothetical protein [Rhizomicrobium sp.]